MDNVVVLEAANNMYYRVDLSYVREELVAETFASRCAAHKTRYVNEFDRRGSYLVRVIHLGELVQPLVRHCDHADIRLDGAERIVRGLRARVCDGVEKCALADIRQTYYS